MNRGIGISVYHNRGSWVKSLCPCLLTLCIVLVFSSCGLDCLFIHEIILEMPRRPVAWLGLEALTYELRWNDEEGKERLAMVAEDGMLPIRLRRGGRAAIRALPHCGATILSQAGGLYPFDVKEPENKIPSQKPDRMQLSFPSGYAAAVADALEAAGRDPWVYPIEKLAAIPDSIGRDPWTLPPWKTAQALVEGWFRISLFPKPKKELWLPSDTEWWPESPHCVIERREEGSVVMLPLGIHQFFSDSERLIVNISDEEVVSQRIFLDGSRRLNSRR